MMEQTNDFIELKCCLHNRKDYNIIRVDNIECICPDIDDNHTLVYLTSGKIIIADLPYRKVKRKLNKIKEIIRW